MRALYEDAEYVWIGTSNGIYKVRLHDKGIADHYTVENNLVRCISKIILIVYGLVLSEED